MRAGLPVSEWPSVKGEWVGDGIRPSGDFLAKLHDPGVILHVGMMSCGTDPSIEGTDVYSATAVVSHHYRTAESMNALTQHDFTSAAALLAGWCDVSVVSDNMEWGPRVHLPSDGEFADCRRVRAIKLLCKGHEQVAKRKVIQALSHILQMSIEYDDSQDIVWRCETDENGLRTYTGSLPRSARGSDKARWRVEEVDGKLALFEHRSDSPLPRYPDRMPLHVAMRLCQTAHNMMVVESIRNDQEV